MVDVHRHTVSVCIPSRNGARQLPDTLTNLLLHSTYPLEAMQVLVGDHGSQDSTAEVVRGFAERFPQLEHVFVPFDSPNRARVRNALIRRSRGDILVFLDHDVLASDDLVRGHVDAHEAFPSALVAGLTYGKGNAEAAFAARRVELDLEHISESRRHLTSIPEFADPRVSGDIVASRRGALIDVGRALAPFRCFWSCNLSARRADIEECGAFDEAYDGWGLEDDDFAHQFYVRAKTLLFSQDAWGFHVPHPTDAWRNLHSWRRNFELLLRKFRTRELEYYGLHGSALGVGARRLESIVNMVVSGDATGSVERASKLLGPAQGRRLCHFVTRTEHAQRLGLTDVLNPLMPLNADLEERGGVRFWPFFGIQTAFEDQEIDETVVLVNVLMRLDRHMVMLVLGEAARFSRRMIFHLNAGEEALQKDHAVEMVRSIASRIRFREVAWL